MASRIPEADLDRLEQYLESPGRAASTLPLDAVQGLLAAVVSAPQPVMPGRWLPAVLGEDHEFAGPGEADAITQVLMDLHNEVARQLNEGEGFDFLLYGEEDDFTGWAEGYLMGVDLAEPSWDECTDPEELAAMLFPFLVLAGTAREMALADGEEWMDEEEEARMVEEIREGFADHVLAVRQFWFEKGIAPTVRRAGPKVGRNDPCPCGSGRKYKACCGK